MSFTVTYCYLCVFFSLRGRLDRSVSYLRPRRNRVVSHVGRVSYRVRVAVFPTFLGSGNSRPSPTLTLGSTSIERLFPYHYRKGLSLSCLLTSTRPISTSHPFDLFIRGLGPLSLPVSPLNSPRCQYLLFNLVLSRTQIISPGPTLHYLDQHGTRSYQPLTYVLTFRRRPKIRIVR